MWSTQGISKILGVRIPLIQAPMAGPVTTPELIAAVANAGGLGSLGAGYMNPNDMRNTISAIRQLTDKPFAVNLFVPENHSASVEQLKTMQTILTNVCQELKIEIDVPRAPFLPAFDEQIEIIIEEKIPICSFTFGVPSQTSIAKLKKQNIILIGTATCLEEAKLLENSGMDIIVAQGSEAGGHRGTFARPYDEGLIGLMALVPQLVDHIQLPIVAAGGIMDTRGIRAAFALGAAGVQMGTAFLACPESGVSAIFQKILLHNDKTTLTNAYSGKYVRALRNKFIENMKPYAAQILNYPIQNNMTIPLRKEAIKKENLDFIAMWSGQAAYLSQAISAAELIKKWDEELQK
jgi:nitronate monooxygenase